MKKPLIFSAVALAGCGGAPSRSPAPAAKASPAPAATPLAPDAPCLDGRVTQAVVVVAADGMAIHGTWVSPCPAGEARPVVVLAHQMCRDRGEWSKPPHDWVAALAARGVATLAIDLRGHGESKTWPDGATHDLCKEIGDAAVQPLYAGMVGDVAAAVAWARADSGGRAAGGRVGVVGASIGANSALVAAGDDDGVAVVVALSPGENYRGIQPAESVRAIAAGGRVAWLVAAEDDARSAAAVRAMAGAGVGTRVYADGGHGNEMLVAHDDALGDFVGEIEAALVPTPRP